MPVGTRMFFSTGYARKRQRALQVFDCTVDSDSLPYLLDRFGNCAGR